LVSVNLHGEIIEQSNLFITYIRRFKSFRDVLQSWVVWPWRWWHTRSL